MNGVPAGAIDPVALCHLDGHQWWPGTGVCLFCEEQLRCLCGRFMRENDPCCCYPAEDQP